MMIRQYSVQFYMKGEEGEDGRLPSRGPRPAGNFAAGVPGPHLPIPSHPAHAPHLQPSFKPLGATVPRPSRRPRKRRHPRARPPHPQAFGSVATPGTVWRQTLPRGAPAGASSTPADGGHRGRPPPSQPPRRRRSQAPSFSSERPGVSFCNFLLANYFAACPAAPPGAPPVPNATIWAIALPGSSKPASVATVGNTLNFNFCIPPHRFLVRDCGSGVFATTAANATIAKVLLTRGGCSVGGFSLLLYPSLPSAAATVTRSSPANDNPPGGDVGPTIGVIDENLNSEPFTPPGPVSPDPSREPLQPMPSPHVATAPSTAPAFIAAQRLNSVSSASPPEFIHGAVCPLGPHTIQVPDLPANKNGLGEEHSLHSAESCSTRPDSSAAPSGCHRACSAPSGASFLALELSSPPSCRRGHTLTP